MSANPAAQRPLLVVTDLMGTTLRDDGAVLPAYRAAFAESSIPFTEEELATKRGAHKLSLFTEFATRRYPADEAENRATAALEVFERQLRHFLASGGGTPIAARSRLWISSIVPTRSRRSGAVAGAPYAAVGEQGDLDPGRVTRHRLVDRVVDDFPDQVVQAALAGGPDVHAGTLADGFEPLEDVDGRRAVVVLLGGHGPRCLLIGALRWCR